MAWWSACKPAPLELNVGVAAAALVLRRKVVAPPSRTTFASVGLTAGSASYRHCVLQNPLLPPARAADQLTPPSVDLRTLPVLLSPVVAYTVTTEPTLLIARSARMLLPSCS